MSSPASFAIFSSQYYNDKFLLSKEKVGGKGPFSWNFRRAHALVDSQNTISVVPFSFFNEIQRYFSWRQDSNLVAVHTRLKELEPKLENSDSPELAALNSEMQQAEKFGTVSLRSNLEQLSACFEKTNAKSSLTLTMMKVINFFRRLLQLEPLKYQKLNPLNIGLFIPTSNLIIESRSMEPLPDSLTTENFQKLENGSLKKLSFDIGGKYCSIEYDRNERTFIFIYSKSKGQPTLHSFFRKEKSDVFLSDSLYLINTSESCSHTLHHQIKYTCDKYPGFLAWFFSMRESYSETPGKLTLKEDCIYICTDPPSQKSFSFMLSRKTP